VKPPKIKFSAQLLNIFFKSSWS